MYEIEHKYLVNDVSVMLSDTSNSDQKKIEQGYVIDDSKQGVLRVRIVDDSVAYLTFKKNTYEVGKNIEVETTIPVDSARLLMDNCNRKISKVRHLFEFDNNLWEIDVFKGELEGLVLAEIELDSTTQQYNKPNWIGKDVTHLSKFSNYILSTCTIDDISEHF